MTSAGEAPKAGRGLLPFYTFAVCAAFLPYLALLPYLYQVSGLTVAQITWLTAAGNVVISLLEIPTGGFGDRFGHKRSLQVGIVVSMIGIALVLILPKTFAVFMAWVTVYAAGFSFISGSDQALLFNYLSGSGRKDEFHLVSGRYAGLGRGVTFAATLAAGPLLLAGGLDYVLLAALAGQAGALISASLLPAGNDLSPGRQRPSYRQILALSWGEMRANGSLSRAIAFGALLLTTAGLAWEYRSLIIEAKTPGGPAMVAAVTAVVTLLFSLSMFVSGATKKLLARDRLMLSYLVMPLGVVAAVLLPGWWGVAALAAYVVGGGVFGVHFRVVLNESIRSSELRATLLSASSLANRLAYTIFVLGFGLLSGLGFLKALLITGFLLLAVYAVLVPGLARSGKTGT